MQQQQLLRGLALPVENVQPQAICKKRSAGRRRRVGDDDTLTLRRRYCTREQHRAS